MEYALVRLPDTPPGGVIAGIDWASPAMRFVSPVPAGP
jgi:hypothetical protein